MKRAFDVAIAAALIVVLCPLLLLIAALVKLTSPGPVLFTQRRLTSHGRVFRMYKFRTMTDQAEAATGAVWAAENDPRVTPFGRFLRKSHLDELPQLFNVLKNDMSLIGPRPERPEFTATLSKEFPSFRRRLDVKAGITGLAQVSSGYAASIDSYRRKLAFDRLYIQKQSPGLDLRIAMKTVVVMFHGE